MPRNLGGDGVGVPLRRIIISGCSGGGKSTLINSLASKGFQTVPEAGRIVVREALASSSDALPWMDRKNFAEKLAAFAIQQFDSTTDLNGVIFFDRSVIEALVYSQMHNFEMPVWLGQAILNRRYDDPVFVVPPWQDIFVEDEERRHSFDAAVTEYNLLLKAFTEFGYNVCEVPRMANKERVEFILNEIGN
jgi:predicted ATPase